MLASIPGAASSACEETLAGSGGDRTPVITPCPPNPKGGLRSWHTALGSPRGRSAGAVGTRPRRGTSAGARVPHDAARPPRVARGVIDRRQAHRVDWGRSCADHGRPSARGVVVTRRFAVAISTYGERAACGISCTRDDARERPKTPALTPHSAGLRPSAATGQRRSVMPPVCSTCTTADTTRSRASSRSVPTTAATRSAWAVKSLAGRT